ncbi:MAG: DUF3572 family protein, partial [Sphingomonadales bacterium]
MPPVVSNPENLRYSEDDANIVTALTALAWTLEDPARARRLLDLTGLTPEDLRAGATDRGILSALLDFLAGHEPDLVACAEAIGIGPADLI